MTDYSATPEQWAAIEELSHSALYGPACILELRARVEALEEAENDRRFRECSAAIDNAKRTPQDRQISSSLVERVADAINSEAGSCFATIEARAAIREVAAWLRDQSPVMHRSGPHWAKVLEQEAER